MSVIFDGATALVNGEVVRACFYLDFCLYFFLTTIKLVKALLQIQIMLSRNNLYSDSGYILVHFALVFASLVHDVAYCCIEIENKDKYRNINVYLILIPTLYKSLVLVVVFFLYIQDHACHLHQVLVPSFQSLLHFLSPM